MLVSFAGWCHPVSLTWVNVRINGDQITASFKVLAEDLIYFHHLEHDGAYNYAVDTLKSLAQKHSEIIEYYFFMIDEQGERIAFSLASVNTHELTGSEIGVMDLMKYSIQYKLTATLKDVNWEKLIFHQKFDDHKIGIPSVTFLSAYSNGDKLVADVELSPGQPFTLYSSNNQPEVNPSRLTSSYFSITPFGIRHELTLPYQEYQVLTGQAKQGFDEHQTLDYFNHYNPIVNGHTKLIPQLRGFRSLQAEIDEQPDPKSLIYLDLYYPSEDITDQVIITWSDYNWQWRWFESTILTIDSTYQHTFSRYQPVFFWERKDFSLGAKK